MEAGGASPSVRKEFADADAFLDSILEEAGLNTSVSAPASNVAAASPSPKPEADSTHMPADFDALRQVDDSTGGPPVTKTASAEDGINSEQDTLSTMASEDERPLASTPQVVVFDMDDAGASAPEVHFTEAEVQSSASSSPYDSSLRDTLASFYRQHNAENLPHVDSIVAKYRGGNVTELWVQLAIKYNVPPVIALDLLGRTIYPGVAQVSQERSKAVLEKLEAVRIDEVQDVDFFMQRIFSRSSSEEALDLLRAIASQGIPVESNLRPMLWKVFLGYLPVTAFRDWATLQDEKRAAFMHYKQEYLKVGADSRLEVRNSMDGSANPDIGQSLLDEMSTDMGSIHPDIEYFRAPKTQISLVSILYVYARLHPDIEYVQGMHEIVAVILYALRDNADSAEADAFWCFCALMKDIKGNFTEVAHLRGEIHAAIGTESSLLSKYDPELSAHLARCELEPGILVPRWVILFFARDIPLPELLQLWDLLLADTERCQLCRYMIVVLLLSSRDSLLGTSNMIELAEIIKAAPREISFNTLLQRTRAFSALERREQVPAFPPMSAVNVVQHVAGAVLQGFFGKF